MRLYRLYLDGVITFEEYTKRLIEKFDAAIKAAENRLKELEAKCIK